MATEDGRQSDGTAAWDATTMVVALPRAAGIAAGEYGYDAWYFRRMLDAGAVDILQADATRALGITGFLQADASPDPRAPDPRAPDPRAPDPRGRSRSRPSSIARGAVAPEAMAGLGPQTAVACPECHGPTWPIGDRAQRRFRCYLGHVATAGELAAANAREVEDALWSAARALHDRVTTLERLAADATHAGHHKRAESLAGRASETRRSSSSSARSRLI